MKRRAFIGLSATTAAFFASSRFYRTAHAQASAGPRVRRDVDSMKEDDPALVAYRTAVKKMQELPASDHRNWTNQAKIHQDACPHGNWFFLPWHRAYLYRFEEICRELSGDSNFALPFWNWTTNRRLPKTFFSGDLDHSPRSTQISNPNYLIPDSAVGGSVIDTILKETVFVRFGSGAATTQRERSPGGQGQLEGNPHNTVHGYVGGDMGNFMSPLDPIFWLHHANVDRIWALWNDRGNANSTDAKWRDFKFTNKFFDGKGQEKSDGVAGFTDVRALGYIYRGQSPKGPGAPAKPKTFLALNQFTAKASVAGVLKEENRLLDVPLELKPDTASLTKAIGLASVAGGPKPAETVLLTLTFAEQPATLQTSVRVFIDCDYASPQTPADDPHVVGAVAFFGGDHVHPAGEKHPELTYVFNLNSAIAALRANGQPVDKDTIRTQLVASSLEGTTAPEIKPTSVTISVVKSE